jgi:hypothetical protein
MGKPSTVGLGFETPFVDLWTVRDYPDLPGSRIGFRAFSKSLRGHFQAVTTGSYVDSESRVVARAGAQRELAALGPERTFRLVPTQRTLRRSEQSRRRSRTQHR